MARVIFTSALNRFFPRLTELEIPGKTVRETLDLIEESHPGIRNYLLEDNGQLRRHVNIFVKGELIKDRNTLNDILGAHDELLITQALSGG